MNTIGVRLRCTNASATNHAISPKPRVWYISKPCSFHPTYLLACAKQAFAIWALLLDESDQRLIAHLNALRLILANVGGMWSSLPISVPNLIPALYAWLSLPVGHVVVSILVIPPMITISSVTTMPAKTRVIPKLS